MTFARLVVCIINFIKRSLQLEIYNFSDALSLKEVSKQAFSKARIKLQPITFQLLNQKLVLEYYSSNAVATFKNLRILAVDGSTLRLPKDQKLYEVFGYDSGNKDSIPLARASIIFDVLNKITLHSNIKKFSSSEREMAREHIQALQQQDFDSPDRYYLNDLLMFDRGYQSLFLMYYISHIEKHFLMRVTHNFLVEVKEFLASGSKDAIIQIDAFSQGRRLSQEFQAFSSEFQERPITVRALVFNLKSGEQEVVLTSLVDYDQFSYQDIFDLYGMRWNVEEEYKYYKVITELENFSGKTEVSIQQDFFTAVFACNIHMMLKNEVEDELRTEQAGFKQIYEYRVNKNILVGIIKDEIINVFLKDCDLTLYCEKLKNRIKKNLVAVRPNRTFPRVYKRVRYKVQRRAM